MDREDYSEVAELARSRIYTEEQMARAEINDIVQHVIGKESRSWEKWYARASQDPITLKTALIAALLSLGAPPHPAFLTQDLAEIVLSTAPPRRTGSDLVRFKQWKDVVDRQYRRQQGYNWQLNAFAHEHGFVYTNKQHDPAQFRKLFAAFLDLHACKVKKGAGR